MTRDYSRLPGVQTLMTAMCAAVLCATFAGCFTDNGRTVQAKGTVLHQGKPLTNASIRFTAKKSGASFPAELDDSGFYEVDLLQSKTGDEYGVSFGESLAPPDEEKLDPAGIPIGNPLPAINKKYFEFGTSGQQVIISGEPVQTFDFELN
ncbi:MAG: hypothetical protein NXI22_00185 [bacterium]|nr:hypothetical protein [bacterium]